MTGPFVFLSLFLFETPPVLEGFVLSRRHVNTHSFSPPSPSRAIHPSIHPSINVTFPSVFTPTVPLNPHNSQTPAGHRRAGSRYSHNKQTVTQSLLGLKPMVPNNETGPLRIDRSHHRGTFGLHKRDRRSSKAACPFSPWPSWMIFANLVLRAETFQHSPACFDWLP